MEEIYYGQYGHEHQNSLEILYLILMKRWLTLLLFLLAEKTEKNRNHFACHRWGIQENPL